MTPGLRFCTPRGLHRMARATKIMDRRTSAKVLWDVNEEQVRLWEVMHAHQHVFGAKPRKVGWSLAGVFANLQETDGADSKGNRIRTVFAIDTDAKALEHVERAEDMAEQWKIRCRARRSAPYSLTFKHGSRFDFLTMGQDEPGRGGDIHRLQITELPYAAHPERAYHALRSACADNAAVLIETTLTTLDPFTASLWRGKRRNPHSRKLEDLGTEFFRHTSFVEDQRSYRLPIVEVVNG